MISWRLPKKIEIEIAKALNTLGLRDYGSALWNIAKQRDQAGPPSRVDPNLFALVLEQATHDPRILSAGEEGAQQLPQIHRDLRNWWRDGNEALIGLPFENGRFAVLAAEWNETTCSDVEMLRAHTSASRQDAIPHCLLIVTEQRQGEAPTLDAPAGVTIVYWRDRVADYHVCVPRFLSLLLHALGCGEIVVLSGRLGFELIYRHGRALSSAHRLLAFISLTGRVEDGVRPSVAPIDALNIGLAGSHATIVTHRESEAVLLRDAGLGRDVVSLEAVPNAVAVDGQDRRSETSRGIIKALFQKSVGDGAVPLIQTDRVTSHDVTVSVILHREQDLVIPALKSMADMVAHARREGLRIEARAVLDRSDARTRELVEAHGAFLDDIAEVSCGDLPGSRNAAVELAGGRYLTFLDGDDLWSVNWLTAAYAAASGDKDGPSIWHPEALLAFFASDCYRRPASAGAGPVTFNSRYDLHKDSRHPDFDPRDLLLENLWSANAFARRDLFERIPYRLTEGERQVGIEDWRWNLETLAAGVHHRLVLGTIHIIRMKEGGSLGQTHEAEGRLPLF